LWEGHFTTKSRDPFRRFVLPNTETIFVFFFHLFVILVSVFDYDIYLILFLGNLKVGREVGSGKGGKGEKGTYIKKILKGGYQKNSLVICPSRPFRSDSAFPPTYESKFTEYCSSVRLKPVLVKK
jgi:hypothetical protein